MINKKTLKKTVPKPAKKTVSKKNTKKTIKKSPKKKKEKIENVFELMHKIFESNISLHEVSIDIVGSYASKYDRSVFDEVLKGLKPKIKTNKGKKEKFSFSDSDISLFLNAAKKYPAQSELFAKNTLVSIVSTIDILFARIFEYHYTKHPEKLSIENQSITFSELKKISKIEEAQKFLINRIPHRLRWGT